MRPLVWNPPVELSVKEEKITKRESIDITLLWLQK